jgi:hypothetical protein
MDGVNMVSARPIAPDAEPSCLVLADAARSALLICKAPTTAIPSATANKEDTARFMAEVTGPGDWASRRNDEKWPDDGANRRVAVPQEGTTTTVGRCEGVRACGRDRRWEYVRFFKMTSDFAKGHSSVTEQL